MESKLVCVRCDRVLRGDVDTFGELRNPMCWNCYAETNAEGGQPYDGIAPHHHDLSQTGSFIGSTVFEDLVLNENGEIELEDGTVFIPDPEAPGCGIYIPPVPVGWH